MNKLEFYPGKRRVDYFVLDIHGVKAQLKCVVEEFWKEQFSRSLSCGRSRKYTLTKTSGVTVTEREELEATISSSLGLEGIAELKSEVKSKVGLELQLEESVETEEEFTFQAPKCARTTFQIYQLLRQYNFSYRDNRSWLFRWLDSSKDFDKATVEWVNRMYDLSTPPEHDPDCANYNPECRRETERSQKSEGLLNLVFEKFGILTGYRLDEHGVVLSNLNVSVPANGVNELIYASVTFDRQMLPPYLLFLTGERANKLTAQVYPYQGELTKIQHRGLQVQRTSQEKRHKRGTTSTDLTTLLIAGGVGAIATLLFTTKSGREIRRSFTAAVREVLASLPKTKQDSGSHELLGSQAKHSEDRGNTASAQGVSGAGATSADLT